MGLCERWVELTLVVARHGVFHLVDESRHVGCEKLFGSLIWGDDSWVTDSNGEEMLWDGL